MKHITYEEAKKLRPIGDYVMAIIYGLLIASFLWYSYHGQAQVWVASWMLHQNETLGTEAWFLASLNTMWIAPSREILDTSQDKHGDKMNDFTMVLQVKLEAGNLGRGSHTSSQLGCGSP